MRMKRPVLAACALALCFAGAACGESSYELAVENGFAGTEREWLESLRGRDGAAGAPGRQGDPGQDGKDGKDGENGKDGEDGAKWYSGSGAPKDETGKVGDFYLDYTGGGIYEKTEVGWMLRMMFEMGEESGDRELIEIVFDLGNGTTESRKIRAGSTVQLPVPHREGLLFLGWYAGEDAEPVTEDTRFYTDTTLTARWKELPRVTIEAGGMTLPVNETYSSRVTYTGTGTPKAYVEKGGERREITVTGSSWGFGECLKRDGEDFYTLYFQFQEAGEYLIVVEGTEEAAKDSVSVTVTA